MIQTLLIILLLEGFITISVETLVIRQLLPFFGGNVLITSIIIGVFLLFLALGYWRGGVTQGNIFERLSRNFSYALIGVGIGLSYTFLTLFYFATLSFGWPFLFNLSLYLLLILAPIVYWLGQTIPLTTNLFSHELRVSHISGRALFISTLGSFLGAILTSLLLFQYLGVAWTIVINCGILFLLILYMKPYSQCSWLWIITLSFALVFIKILNVDVERNQFLKTNNYGNYEVTEPSPATKIFKINESYSSLITTDKSGFPFVEYIRNILFNHLNLRNKKILVIGAGGFSLTAKGTQGNDFTYIDIDPAIKSLAEKWFLNNPIQGKFIGQDARAYLNENQTKYDVIISDAYSNQNTIPASLLTVEYFNAIADHLRLDGIMMVNIIADPLFGDDYARTVSNTIHAVFPYCMVVPVNLQKQPIANLIYTCRKSQDKMKIYSDNLSTSMIDFFNSRQRLGK